MPGTTTTPSPQRSWSPNLCYDDDLGGWIDCSKALLYWMSLCGPTEDFDLATMSCVPKGSARQSADQQYMSMQAQPALAPMSAMPQPRAGIPGTRPGPVGPNQYNPPQPLDVMGMGIMINPQERMMGMPMQPVVPGAAPQPPPKTCPPGYTLGPNGCVDASGNPPPSPGWPTIPTRLARPMQPFTPQAVPPAPTDQQLSCISDCRVKYRGQPGKMQACIGFCDEVHGRGVASFAQPRRRSIPRGVAQVQMPGGVIADASDVCFLYAEAKCQLLGYCSTDQWNAFEQECYQHLRKPLATGAPNLPAPGQQVPGGQTRLWSAARAGVCPEGLCLEGAAIGKPRCVECPEVELAAPVRTRRRRRRKTGLARLLNL